MSNKQNMFKTNPKSKNKDNIISDCVIEKKYKIPSLFKNLLGFKQETFLTLNEFKDKFMTHMINSKNYNYETGYFLVYNIKELVNVFRQEIIKQSDLKYYLDELLIEYNSQLKTDQTLPKTLPLNDSSSNDSSSELDDKLSYNLKGNINEGWNINNEVYQLNYANIHLSYSIIKRDFFIKETVLSDYRFE